VSFHTIGLQQLQSDDAFFRDFEGIVVAPIFALTSGMVLIGTAEVNHVTGLIIRAAVEVHRALGPGLLESAYQACLVYELRALELSVEHDIRLPLNYKAVKLDRGYKIDVRVNGCVVVELKCVSKLTAIHDAQLITYLKLTDCPMGLLLNFNVALMKHGIRRGVHPNMMSEVRGLAPRE
jgi:GxxExxY protein